MGKKLVNVEVKKQMDIFNSKLIEHYFFLKSYNISDFVSTCVCYCFVFNLRGIVLGKRTGRGLYLSDF